MTRILVTGASGFIGSALCPALRLKNHEVETLQSRDGDIADATTLERIGPVQHVIHLAGRTFVPDSWKEPAAFQKTNVLGTANVLEFCRTRGARLTFVSAYLYGAPERLPVSEDCTPRPNNPYAMSKHLAEQVCEFYTKQYGVAVTVIRPFNIFGPGQKAHFLIPHIVRQVREGRSIQVKDLEPRRDYLYIDDMVDALVRTLGAPSGYNVVNIGSGTSVSVRELIYTIQSVAGTALQVISEGETRHNEITDVYADIGQARLLLRWSPKLSLKQGIKKMMLQESGS